MTNAEFHNGPQRRKRRREHKLRAIAYKGGRCSACGFSDLTYPSIFEFHHLEPGGKDSGPAKLLRNSFEKAKKELDKCILLCANCHRIAHEEEYTNE